ncbi:SMI1/KNR4 family protein [uncultured Aquimarina sp.]|uniref:SMI1/KNR4 family protein n=1 Tax=uncultured Aquimarina sp. TaxID=575652 RepID=UPI002637DEBE|nr:SMI1/KNR4 family protein [uncultured Aquimarina sp.]
MKDYSIQIERIKSKLLEAAKVDKGLKAFGASSHKYNIHNPVSIEEVNTFERKYSINLPDCYKSFVLQIGNGGKSYANSGAGPFYGIYPLGDGVDELVYKNTEKYIKNESILHPKMTNDYWSKVIEKIEIDNISDSEYEQELGKIFGGILPIGSQGCSYLHGIILNGTHKGKVVNIDQDLQKPHFTFEDNFLDWYERWLDEVISKDLLIESPSWFGYTMGGSEEKLLEAYKNGSSDIAKEDALNGLLKKRTLNSFTLDSIDKLYLNTSKENSKLLLQILVKYKHKTWKEYLTKQGKDDLLTVFQYIFWYDKANSTNWKEYITSHINQITNPETFRFCTYLLQECNFDYGYLIQGFIKNTDKDIRSTVVYSLGQLSNKKDYLETFIIGLNDDSNKVIHSSLQALSGIKNEKLLIHYKKIADRFPVEKDYILSNLKQRLAEFKIDLNWIRKNDLNKIPLKSDKKWYQIWK